MTKTYNKKKLIQNISPEDFVKIQHKMTKYNGDDRYEGHFITRDIIHLLDKETSNNYFGISGITYLLKNKLKLEYTIYESR